MVAVLPAAPRDEVCCAAMAHEIVRAFLAATRTENVKLAKGLDRLDDDAQPALATVLRSFDTGGAGELDAEDRGLARRPVLQHVDADGNGVLAPEERARLRDQLWDADAFLSEQKQSNPKLRKLLG